MLASVLLLASLAAPCVRPTRAGTQLQGDVRICPGRYRIADPTAVGVLILAASGTRVDLTGVTIESGDSLPGNYTGVGIASRGVDAVAIVGGTVRGYRFGVLLQGGRAHRVAGTILSGSRTQRLRSTAEKYDEHDWLDIFHADTAEAYGGGVLLKGTDGASVTGIVARDAQNGIGLVNARNSYIADNDVSHNSGWGVHLWHSSHNTIMRNDASHNVRCEGKSYSDGCDSAALLLREQSDSNVVADNDLSHSGDGFFLSGQPPQLQPSVGNIVLRNDATGAYHNAFESTFSWGNSFIENHADSSAFGFWLGYSSANVVRGNTVLGSREAGIAIEHGSDHALAANVIIGGKIGIRLFAPGPDTPESRGYRIDDNVLARSDRGLVLEHTTRSKVRGNIFDGVGEGLVVDEAGRGTVVLDNVFLRATRLFVRADTLDAGHNFWGAADAAQARAKTSGHVTVEPFQPASAAGF
jgi:parallel beta-helix repeat protein